MLALGIRGVEAAGRLELAELPRFPMQSPTMTQAAAIASSQAASTGHEAPPTLEPGALLHDSCPRPQRSS